MKNFSSVMGLRAKSTASSNSTTTTATLNNNNNVANGGGGSGANSPSATKLSNNFKFFNGSSKKLNKLCKSAANSNAREQSSAKDTHSPTSPTSCKITSIRTTFRSTSSSALLNGILPSTVALALNGTASVAAASACVRPQTLNVHHHLETPSDHTQLFLGEVLAAWRAKARCNVVPAERTQELFQELSFHPNDKQISEMLQTAKLLARKGSRQSNGLTFGEFCVLAADLKRFRTSSFGTPSPGFCDDKQANHFLSSLQQHDDDGDKTLTEVDNSEQQNENKTKTQTTAAGVATATATSAAAAAATTAKNISNALNCSFPGNELRTTKSLSSVEDCKKLDQKKLESSANNAGTGTTTTTTGPPVEVFLGGSCNPTTWRADVAIPALKESGISFYNPQVSDWTPDLIELEHRAKEKARVLFFVMDSETRASAGAIEAAHIAGQNCKQLVLVLHPYRPQQSILNENISQQEYIDLMRNQLILRELVTRRGLPVLDNIPSGLQRTKEILAGFRDPPSNIASILVVVRGAFDRVNANSSDAITVEQCQRALLYLGYSQSLVKLDNLQKIIAAQRESLDSLLLQQQQQQQQQQNDTSTNHQQQQPLSGSGCGTLKKAQHHVESDDEEIDFDLFCVISAYLSVLQQEIHESGCISPIKGTNVPPPPVYLSNLQGEDSFAISYFSSKNISRTSSNTSVPCTDERLSSLNDLLTRNRDSGTSSPQPMEPLRSRSQILIGKQPLKQQQQQQQILLNVETIETTEVTTTQTLEPQQQQTNSTIAHSPLNIDSTAAHHQQYSTPTPPPASSAAAPSISSSASNITEEESDSNDSVFSSSSSINSINYCDPALNYGQPDFREVYLGGSCVLRTKWRQELAIPFLKSKGISYHLPALQESLNPALFNLPAAASTNAATAGQEGSLEEDESMQKISAAAGSSNWRVRRQPTSAATNFMRTRRKCRTNSGNKTSVEEEELTIAEESLCWTLAPVRTNLFNPLLLDSSRVLLFIITNETRSLAPMTLAAHCIGLMYNVVLAVQMLPENCVIGNEKLTPTAIKDYNRGRSYLIDLAKRQGVPVFNDIKAALECTAEKIQSYNSRRYD